MAYMDHKLKIFKTVASTKSFSQASKQLNISQPAVSKTVKNLEEKYGKAFFNRKPNAIELTKDGEVFLVYVNKILQLYNSLEDVFLEGKSFTNELKIGASTTIANYILPQLIVELQKKHPELKIDLIVGNTLEIQQLVLKNELDLGIVEGHNQNTRLHYDKFIKDELVLTTVNNPNQSDTITTKELQELPFICREIGSGTREVIENILQQKQVVIKNYQSTFGSTESIKNFLLNSDTYAFMSVHSIQQELKEGRLRIIDIEELEINRWFYFITRQGFQSKLNDKIQQEFRADYNQK